MTKLKLIGILVLLFVITSFTVNNENTALQLQDKWIKLNETDYSIDYPETWELNTTGQMGTSFILFSPVSSEEDQFRDNVNLLIQDLSAYNLDLDKYTEISLEQIKTQVSEGGILESKRIIGKPYNYHKVIYTGSQDVLKLKFEQYYWLVNNQAYILTFTTEESQFETLKATGERILDSFKLSIELQ